MGKSSGGQPAGFQTPPWAQPGQGDGQPPRGSMGMGRPQLMGGGGYGDAVNIFGRALGVPQAALDQARSQWEAKLRSAGFMPGAPGNTGIVPPGQFGQAPAGAPMPRPAFMPMRAPGPSPDDATQQPAIPGQAPQTTQGDQNGTTTTDLMTNGQSQAGAPSAGPMQPMFGRPLFPWQR